MHDLDARRARNLLLTQAILAVLVAGLVGLLNVVYARDVLIGGLAALAGTLVFALWVFGRYNAAKPGQIVARFYGGELLRIMAIVVVFGLAMKGLDDLNPVALFGSFFVVQVLPPLLANKIAR